MNHQNKNYKLGRDTKHRKSLKYNLVRSMVLHEKIVTTFAKAKYMQPTLEKIISLSKNEDLSSYRALLSFFRNDEVAAKKAFKIGMIMKKRPGGYSKIIKLGQRKGDSAHQACVMFSEVIS